MSDSSDLECYESQSESGITEHVTPTSSLNALARGFSNSINSPNQLLPSLASKRLSCASERSISAHEQENLSGLSTQSHLTQVLIEIKKTNQWLETIEQRLLTLERNQTSLINSPSTSSSECRKKKLPTRVRVKFFV